MGNATDEPIDYTDKVLNADNFCFLTEAGDGGYMIINHGAGLYVAHTLATPEGRGTPMYRLMRQGFDYLFTRTDCEEIATFVPDGNEKAAQWTKLAGFRPTFRREDFVPLGGGLVGAQFHTMTYDEWVGLSPSVEGQGKYFHEMLEDQIGRENHPEDRAHNRHVGAALLCAKSANLRKGINHYNRWASLAGYLPAQVLSLTPPLINIGTALVAIGEDGLEIQHIFGGRQQQ